MRACARERGHRTGCANPHVGAVGGCAFAGGAGGEPVAVERGWVRATDEHRCSSDVSGTGAVAVQVVVVGAPLASVVLDAARSNPDVVTQNVPGRRPLSIVVEMKVASTVECVVLDRPVCHGEGDNRIGIAADAIEHVVDNLVSFIRSCHYPATTFVVVEPVADYSCMSKAVRRNRINVRHGAGERRHAVPLVHVAELVTLDNDAVGRAVPVDTVRARALRRAPGPAAVEPVVRDPETGADLARAANR